MPLRSCTTNRTVPKLGEITLREGGGGREGEGEGEGERERQRKRQRHRVHAS